MVSLQLMFVSAVVLSYLSAQTSFRPESRLDLPAATAPRSDVKPAITPEMRGDIYMARKMYREAVEAYKEGPEDSHVIWNKIGIAYHQMGQLDNARKNYERSLKLNSK